MHRAGLRAYGPIAAMLADIVDDPPSRLDQLLGSCPVHHLALMNDELNCNNPVLIDFWSTSPEPGHCPVDVRWTQLIEAFAACTVHADNETITLTLANGATLVFVKSPDRIEETFNPASL